MDRPGCPAAQGAINVVLGSAGSNSYTVIGRQLNGASAGSSYGDDVESDENYPIVSLTARDGSVFYATTSNWSNTDVGKKGAQTVDFTLHDGMPADKYRLVVSGAASGPSRSASVHGQSGWCRPRQRIHLVPGQPRQRRWQGRHEGREQVIETWA